MLRAVALSLGLVMVGVPAAAEIKASSTPDQLRAAIRDRGAKDVLWSLWEQDELFGALLKHVERGEKRWFDVWLALRASPDGGATESIDMAFARAIPKAPAEVLRLVGNGLPLERVCTSPFIEPAAGVAERYETAALHALSQVHEPALEQTAKECAERVRLPKVRGA